MEQHNVFILLVLEEILSEWSAFKVALMLLAYRSPEIIAAIRK